MQQCKKIDLISTYGMKCLKYLSVTTRNQNRSLILTSVNAAFVRRPIQVHDPQQSQINLKTPIFQRKSNEDREQSLNNSSSIFNLTMGEVIMSKSRKRFAVEGTRLVEEALGAGLKLEKLFILKSLKDLSPTLNNFLEQEEEQNIKRKSDAEIHRVSAKLMQTWSSVTTPPGIIGIFTKPKSIKVISRSTKPEDNVPLTVICDNIREPGNLGSILRSAAGAGCKEVFLTKGCVDAWNMKVLRGACGAHFYIPIFSDIPADTMRFSILKTVTGGENEVQEPALVKVAVLVADSNVEDLRLDLPLLSHSEVDYTSFQHVFLVIGGETEGISNEVVQLVKDVSANKRITVVPARVRISLANNIDSLNAANAFGIIAFEMGRQLRSSRLTSSNSSSKINA